MTQHPGRIKRLRSAALSDQKRLSARLLVILGLGWMPFMILLVIEGVSTGVWSPILLHFETYVRWLISVPVLLLSERAVGNSIRGTISYLSRSEIISTDSKIGQLNAIDALYEIERSRSESPRAELIILVIAAVYGIPQVLKSLSPAESWHAGVAMTFFRFLLLKVLWKWLLWVETLWRISKMKLRLLCAHPDHMGGIAPVIDPSKAMAPYFAAITATLSASIASLLLKPNESVMQHTTIFIGAIVAAILIAWIPTLMLIPQLVRFKRETKVAYGLLGQRVVQDFEQSYLRSHYLGEINTSSLADFGGVYDLVDRTKTFPIEAKLIVQFTLIVISPFVPLLMIEFGVTEFLHRVAGILI